MAEQTITLTDPARELAELCEALQSQADQKGEAFLAAKFGVEPWSREFFEIIFTVTERCDLVKRIVHELPLDTDYALDLGIHVDNIAEAFSADSMKSKWNTFGGGRVGPLNASPVKMASGLVRQRIAYPRLLDEEIIQIRLDISTLLDWLRDHQLTDRDFIRGALIEGLETLAFRLQSLKWLGWGYTLKSLREVIAAYVLLDRGVDPLATPDAAAVLQKVGATMKAVYEKVTATKNVSENGEWLLKLYGAGSLVYQTGKPLIAGLLGSA